MTTVQNRIDSEMLRKQTAATEKIAAALSEDVYKIANAISPQGTLGGHDANGGYVTSLTEAVMGVTAGLCRIADAIEHLADAVDDHGK